MEEYVVNMISKLRHKENRLRRMRTALCTVLSFLLSIAFVGIAVLFVIQWSCFNNNSIYNSLTSSKYYENIQTDIYTKAEAITMPTGLSLEVLDNITDLSRIQQDVNGYVKAGFRGEAYEADTTLLESKLENNIDQYLKSMGIKPDQEQESNIVYYVEAISEEYRNAMQISLLNFLISVKDLYHKVYQIGIIFGIVVIAIVIGMLIKMNESVHSTLRYVGYSTIAATLMIGIAPTAALYSGFYKKIQLSPLYYYNFAINFVTNILNSLIIFSLFLAFVSLIIIVTLGSSKKIAVPSGFIS